MTYINGNNYYFKSELQGVPESAGTILICHLFRVYYLLPGILHFFLGMIYIKIQELVAIWFIEI